MILTLDASSLSKGCIAKSSTEKEVQGYIGFSPDALLEKMPEATCLTVEPGDWLAGSCPPEDYPKHTSSFNVPLNTCIQPWKTQFFLRSSPFVIPSPSPSLQTHRFPAAQTDFHLNFQPRFQAGPAPTFFSPAGFESNSY